MYWPLGVLTHCVCCFASPDWPGDAAAAVVRGFQCAAASLSSDSRVSQRGLHASNFHPWFHARCGDSYWLYYRRAAASLSSGSRVSQCGLRASNFRPGFHAQCADSCWLDYRRAAASVKTDSREAQRE
jgi:hypothetical protein